MSRANIPLSSKNKIYLSIAALLIIAAGGIFFISAQSVSSPGTLSQNSNSTELQVRVAALSRATSDQCSYLGDKQAIYASVMSQPNSTYFQGSCCSPMVFSHYVQQIGGLKNYSDIAMVPPDPYNVSVGQVKRMLNYYDNITLNQTQNATFNEAAPLTQDKSWCCCQCWAWYAHAGLAKYLIKNYNFNVSQVVTVINLEDCCGG